MESSVQMTYPLPPGFGQKTAERHAIEVVWKKLRKYNHSTLKSLIDSIISSNGYPISYGRGEKRSKKSMLFWIEANWAFFEEPVRYFIRRVDSGNTTSRTRPRELQPLQTDENEPRSFDEEPEVTVEKTVVDGVKKIIIKRLE